MSAATPLDEIQIHGFEGRTLGGFRLSCEIACGGMATVYLAHKAGAHGIGQPAAVKVIHPHLSREREFVEMFLDEARIVSCIGHPNVCRVLDFGRAEGTYYLAMEYVLGETWADVLHRMKATPEAQPMIPAVLAQVLAQSCEGLHAAHEARDPHGSLLQIVHRDISPQNIIVGYDGSVRVLDFGIASAAEKLHTTRHGTVKGRFAYMAPEQMRGLAVDRRADVWSVGVVLWEGLAQRRLFRRETEAETVLAVTHDPLPSLSSMGHRVPAALARIALQALERERHVRYGTAREIGLELSRFASSSLVPMGMPELSMLMQGLFADQIDKKRAILREAANAAEAGAGPSILPPVLFTDSKSHDDSERIAQGTSGSRDGGGLPSISTVRAVRQDEPRRVHAVIGALIALAIAGVVALAGRGLDKNTAPAAAHKAPAAATAPRLAAKPPKLVPKVTQIAIPAEPENAKLDIVIETATAAASPEPAATPAPAATPEAAPAQRVVHKRVERAGVGTVSIATNGGWADVYLGNRKLGTTPARYELPAGVHNLRMRPFGRGPEITRRVEVRPNAAVKLKIALE